MWLFYQIGLIMQAADERTNTTLYSGTIIYDIDPGSPLYWMRGARISIWHRQGYRDHMDLCDAGFAALCANPTAKSVNFEALRGYENLYSSRVPHASDRLLYTILKHPYDDFYTLYFIGYITIHKYKRLLDNNAAKNRARTIQLQAELKVTDEEQFSPPQNNVAASYDANTGKVISLTNMQEEAIGTPGPAIVTGPPGSGKTVTIEARIDNARRSGYHRAIYYIAPANMVEEAKRRDQDRLDAVDLCTVHRLTYQDFLSVIDADFAAIPQTVTTVEEAHNWIAARIKKHKRDFGVLSDISVDKIYQEWRMLSAYDADEIDAYLRGVGKRNTLFPGTDEVVGNLRRVILMLFNNYMDSLQGKKVNFDFYLVKNITEFTADVEVMVDEFQNLSRCQIKNLVSSSRAQIVFAGDDGQKINGLLSNLNYIKDLMYGLGLTLRQFNFNQILRCPATVVRVLKRFQQIRNVNCGGIVNRDADGQIDEEYSSGEDGEVMWITDLHAMDPELSAKFSSYLQHSRTVIICREEDKELARRLLTPDPAVLILTPEEALGLEWDTVIQFNLGNEAVFFNAQIPAIDENHANRGTAGDERQLLHVKWNRYYAATSRTLIRWLVIETEHLTELQPLMNALMTAAESRSLTSAASETAEQRQENILTSARALLSMGKTGIGMSYLEQNNLVTPDATVSESSVSEPVAAPEAVLPIYTISSLSGRIKDKDFNSEECNWRAIIASLQNAGRRDGAEIEKFYRDLFMQKKPVIINKFFANRENFLALQALLVEHFISRAMTDNNLTKIHHTIINAFKKTITDGPFVDMSVLAAMLSIPEGVSMLHMIADAGDDGIFKQIDWKMEDNSWILLHRYHDLCRKVYKVKTLDKMTANLAQISIEHWFTPVAVRSFDGEPQQIATPFELFAIVHKNDAGDAANAAVEAIMNRNNLTTIINNINLAISYGIANMNIACSVNPTANISEMISMVMAQLIGIAKFYNTRHFIEEYSLALIEHLRRTNNLMCIFSPIFLQGARNSFGYHTLIYGLISYGVERFLEVPYDEWLVRYPDKNSDMVFSPLLYFGIYCDYLLTNSLNLSPEQVEINRIEGLNTVRKYEPLFIAVLRKYIDAINGYSDSHDRYLLDENSEYIRNLKILFSYSGLLAAYRELLFPEGQEPHEIAVLFAQALVKSRALDEVASIPRRVSTDRMLWDRLVSISPELQEEGANEVSSPVLTG